MNDYEVETAEYLTHGLQLFQYGLFADTEIDHVRVFCAYTNPHGVVVDMGAGVGAMGAYLQEISPAVCEVVNVTNSKTQHAHMVSRGLTSVLSDFHSVAEVLDESADFVMFNESFGYGSPEALLTEPVRMLKSGGICVIKDFSVNRRLTDVVDLPGWGYRIFPQHRVLEAAAHAGLRCILVAHPKITTARWHRFLQNSRMADWHGTEDYDGTTALFVFLKAPK